jgi:hypothetical protein
MAELTVGQKVRVLPYAHSKYGEVVEGEVVKIARVRVTIRVYGREVQFDKNTGGECVAAWPQTFETDNQFAERELRDFLLAVLHDTYGLTWLPRFVPPDNTKLNNLLAVMQADE